MGNETENRVRRIVSEHLGVDLDKTVADIVKLVESKDQA